MEILTFVADHWAAVTAAAAFFGLTLAPTTLLYKLGFKLGRFIRKVLRQRAGAEGGRIATTLYDLIHGIADGLLKPRR